MSIEKARAHYAGKDGHAKLNCAQTIINAFKDKFSYSDDTVARFAGHGGGRAPEGECGSLYAARFLLDKAPSSIIKECESALRERAGSTKCREIRAGHKLSCLGCVETVAAYVYQVKI
ncbi:MAG: C-GCAxxG-C-C family protein [Candidatus Omnitrophica bacterium]|nr:C-GCAxxG-C-C family protein [Candidatus Omnitrophota bacterium]